MPPPARRAGPQMGRGAPSYFDVVPILEQARAGQPLDPVGQIESEVRQLEASRPHDPPRPPPPAIDRKSTRLNSSHLVISYAVFCLKKKNKTRNQNTPASQDPQPLMRDDTLH